MWVSEGINRVTRGDWLTTPRKTTFLITIMITMAPHNLETVPATIIVKQMTNTAFRGESRQSTRTTGILTTTIKIWISTIPLASMKFLNRCYQP
jgi:hypothetical protein